MGILADNLVCALWFIANGPNGQNSYEKGHGASSNISYSP